MKKVISNGGFVEWRDKIPDAESVRIARDFLLRLVWQVCRQASKYHHEQDNHFLRYSERMMYSQFASAIHAFAPIHMSEHSIKRNLNGNSSSGRVDFWIYYRGVNILLELKQQYVGMSIGVETLRVKNGLKVLVGQTKSLKREAKDWGQRSVVIGLDVILPYSQRTGELRYEKAYGKIDRNQLCKAFRKNVIEHDSRPNFAATWLPPGAMTRFDTELEGKYEFNPFVGFAAYVVAI